MSQESLEKINSQEIQGHTSITTEEKKDIDLMGQEDYSGKEKKESIDKKIEEIKQSITSDKHQVNEKLVMGGTKFAPKERNSKTPWYKKAAIFTGIVSMGLMAKESKAQESSNNLDENISKTEAVYTTSVKKNNTERSTLNSTVSQMSKKHYKNFESFKKDFQNSEIFSRYKQEHSNLTESSLEELRAQKELNQELLARYEHNEDLFHTDFDKLDKNINPPLHKGSIEKEFTNTTQGYSFAIKLWKIGIEDANYYEGQSIPGVTIHTAWEDYQTRRDLTE